MSDWLQQPVYGLKSDEKRVLFNAELDKLEQLHYQKCNFFAKWQATWNKPRPLPVRLFKHLDIKSIADDEIFKVLTSSGTTGQAVSKIYLDRETAQLQAKTLIKIMQNWLGKKRLPMLILDSSAVLKDPKMFSARGAGILGLSNFGRDHTYALNSSMELQLDVLKQFCQKYKGQPKLLFGFTFMVWQHFLQTAKQIVDKFDLSDSILIHSGGWKKLDHLAVDNNTFKRKLLEAFNIEKVHNFYGFVEQVGSIFVECECGFFHAPISAEVFAYDIQKHTELSFGESGILRAQSLVPNSYPGQDLITEDRVIIHGEDDCKCGRNGKYFSILGRLPKAEIRGCSDVNG